MLRIPGRDAPLEAPFAPWGVQLAGNFSKDRALATFRRTSRAYASVLGSTQPMIIGTRLRYRGARTFYRVRAPAATRQEAEQLCSKNSHGRRELHRSAELRKKPHHARECGFFLSVKVQRRWGRSERASSRITLSSMFRPLSSSDDLDLCSGQEGLDGRLR